jgi:hypothetical protein
MASIATAIAVRERHCVICFTLPIQASAQEIRIQKRSQKRSHVRTTMLPHAVKKTSRLVCVFALRKFLAQRDCRKSAADGDNNFFFRKQNVDLLT